MINSSPLFLLDANVLINASNLYYPLDAVPEYWEWLAYMGSKGLVKMPFEIFDEVKEGPKDQPMRGYRRNLCTVKIVSSLTFAMI
jgi:hypothetical protein